VYSIPRLGTWNQPGQTQSANTQISIPIPPWPGDPKSGLPFLCTLDSQGLPSWTKQGGAYTHVTKFGITTSSTAHICYFLRPLNYAIVSTAGAKNTTSLIIDKDPGIYSANWRYPGTPVNVADNAMAANDFFAVQLADGTWFYDKVAGVSGTPNATTITTTTTIPNITGNSIPVGNAFFFFGIGTDVDPATGFKQTNVSPNVSVYTEFSDAGGDGIASSLRPGDPMYFIDANATGADTVAFISGYFGKV